jgi:hypothetical protein
MKACYQPRVDGCVRQRPSASRPLLLLLRPPDILFCLLILPCQSGRIRTSLLLKQLAHL